MTEAKEQSTMTQANEQSIITHAHIMLTQLHIKDRLKAQGIWQYRR